MTPRRTSLITALAAVLVAGFAACGGSNGHASSSTTTSPIRTFADAANATNAARTARESMVASISQGSDQSDILAADGVFAIDGSAAEYHGGAAGVSFDGLIVGSNLYYAYPKMPPGKKWVQLDTATLRAQTGIDLGAAGQQSSVDASQALRLLARESGTITAVDTETVHGATTTHFRAPVDMAKAATNSKVLSGPALRLAQRLGVIPYDVWVDGQRRVRRIRYAIPGDRFGSKDIPADALVTYTFELWDFGAPLHVVAPPVAEVVSLAAFRQWAQSQARPAT